MNADIRRVCHDRLQSASSRQLYVGKSSRSIGQVNNTYRITYSFNSGELPSMSSHYVLLPGPFQNK